MSDITDTWSNLAKIVYKRTYARKDKGFVENWSDTVDRVIQGNVRNHDVSKEEIEKLRYFMLNRKAGPAGRGYWFSGAPSHEALGGAALNNCWFVTLDKWDNFVLAQDLLMLGGGVGGSIEHRFVSKLPTIKPNVTILHKNTKDANFIVPDSREGWNELTRRVLEAFFVTGKSFTYSCICVRGKGEAIAGFGGTSSGPLPLIKFIDKICSILVQRTKKHIRPIDAMDLLCCIGEMVVSGNVRRSAIIILGDAWDKEFLTSKRWDLGAIPTERAMANLSVVCSDTDDLHPLFWKTYEQGEPFGIVNRKNIRKYGRMGEEKPDTAQGMNPCVTGNTLILTKKGYIAIASVVGEDIEIWNGYEWSKVVPKITGENQPILKIKFSDGRELKCTPYHKFHLAIGYRGETTNIEAIQLKIGDKLIKHNFPTLDNGTKASFNAYTQGFKSAEGMNDYKYFSIYEPKFMCSKRLGFKGELKGKKVHFTHNCPLPKEYVPFDLGMEDQLNWLAGLFDGDGCELKEGGIQLVSIDFNFLTNLQNLLSLLGVQSKIVPGNEEGFRSLPDGHGGSEKYFCKESKRILIGAIQIQSLKSLGMKCERLPLDKEPQRDASQFSRVISIEEAGIADFVYCFNETKRHLGIFNGIITGQCAEATLENGEPCNLQEIFLPNLKDEEEFIDAAILMHRYGKRITCEKFHNKINADVVKRNRRIGTGITGCLQSPLFNPDTLDKVYKAIQRENINYSKELGIPESIRTTVVKPSGTLSIIGDVTPGIHASYSKFYIRRVRFSSDDDLIPILKKSGHNVEPSIRFDGSLDNSTFVVDFYCKTPEGTPVADENWDMFKQLEVLLMAQKHWSDQAVSVTVYYKKQEIGTIKTWLKDNLKNLKSISFLCHNDHGFKQAPLEAITEEQYLKFISKTSPIEFDNIKEGILSDSLECENGFCPIK